jgi:hypothetical protein
LQFEDTDENAKLEKASAELGRRLVQAIERKETWPEMEENIKQAFEIMSFLVQTQGEKWPVAVDYWNKHWQQQPTD